MIIDEKIALIDGVKLHRLVITCDSHNRPSANVALRNGYKFENTNRQAIYSDNAFNDREVYSKLYFEK